MWLLLSDVSFTIKILPEIKNKKKTVELVTLCIKL